MVPQVMLLQYSDVKKFHLCHDVGTQIQFYEKLCYLKSCLLALISSPVGTRMEVSFHLTIIESLLWI
jgi:hypothetical protein